MVRVEYYSDRGGYNGTTRGQKDGYREKNEDTILVQELESHDGSKYIIAVVCDGMGGGVDGKFSSSKVCDEIKNALEGVSVPESDVLLALQNTLYRAINNAHGYIFNKYKGKKASATTCTAVITDGVSYRYLHIGDSRMYELGDKLNLITTDDTWVQREIMLGKMTEAQAQVHPKRHMITKAVGVGRVLQVLVSPECTLTTDLLITSDGFSEFLNEDKASILRSREGELENMAKMMVEEGQKDNLSAIILRKD